MTKFLDTKGLERVISKLKTLIAGKADKSHTHTKSQISDFPKSMPASDVAAWAKAATKPGYSWGEISGKPSTFAPSSHTHDDRYYLAKECNDMFQPKGSYAAASHTHSQYLTSHQSLANYYTKTDCDSKFQPKGSYAAASHTHMDTLIFDFSSNSSQSPRFPVGALKRDVRIICGGSPSGAPSLNVSSLAATLANGYYVEVINQISNKDVTFSMPHMVLQGTNWIRGTTKYIMPGRLYRFICCNGMMWDLNTNVR